MQIQVLDKELYGSDDFSPAHEGDAGIDLRARENHVLKTGEIAKIPLGVATALPPGTYGMCGSRGSTLLESGLLVQEGKIDRGYRGELHCIACAARETVIERGDRICQLIVVRIVEPRDQFYGLGFTRWEVVDELDETERGDKAFASSGVR